MKNSNSKIIGFIVVILIVLIGIWLMTRRSPEEDISVPPAAQTTENAAVAPSNTSPADTISASGTSDAALNQDAASIDGQIGNLSTEAGAAQSSQ